MARKRSVRVEETENKARAEIQRAWLSFPPGAIGGTRPLRGTFIDLSGFGFPITFCLCWGSARPCKMRCGIVVSTTNAMAELHGAWNTQ